MQELVNHPGHYATCAPETRVIVRELGIPEVYHDTECVEAIESIYHIRTNYHLSSAVEYLWRYGKKDGSAGAQRDLAKAKWFMERHAARYPGNRSRDLTVLVMIESVIDGAAHG